MRRPYELIHAPALLALQGLQSRSAHVFCSSLAYWQQRAYRGKDAYGSEKTREEWADRQVEMFSQVRRVLRDDGTAFAVVGEGAVKRQSGSLKAGEATLQGPYLAERLREDGWHVKALVVIDFTNRPPKSVKNRPVQTHEYGIMLAKNASDFFWDHLSSRERGVNHDRLLRSVWTGQREDAYVTPKVRFKHTSTYPRWIPDRYLSGAVSADGVCPECGAPRVPKIKEATGGSKGKSWHDHSNDPVNGNAKTASSKGYTPAQIVGWKAGCACKTDKPPARPLVIDPFTGTSTTGVVAMSRHCDFWGSDGDDRCIRVSKERLREHAEELKTPLFDSERAAQRQKPLFAEDDS